MRALSLTGGVAPFVIVVSVSMVLLAGASLGATQAAAGEEQIDLQQELHDSVFTEDGELKDSEPDSNVQPDAAVALEERTEQVMPDTPRFDAFVEETLIIPMVAGMTWIAAVGYQSGYAMAVTIGTGATKVVLNGLVLGLLAGTGLYTYRVAREVFR